MSTRYSTDRRYDAYGRPAMADSVRPATPPVASIPYGSTANTQAPPVPYTSPARPPPPVPYTSPAPGSRPPAPVNPNDTRGTMFNPTPSAATSQAQNMASQLAQNMASYQFPGFQSVGTANYGAARNYLGQAAGAVGGMNIGQYGNIAANNYSRSYGLLGQAQGMIPGGNSIRDFRGVSGPGSFDESQQSQQVRDMTMERLKALNGPDRGALAESNFNRLEQSSRPEWEDALRTVGQKNAALGRLGSGMVTNNLMDITAQREQYLARARGQLSDDAAARTLEDRLGVLGGHQSVYGQFGGEDRANAGMDQSMRDETRREREAGIGYDFGKSNLALQRSQATSGLAGQYAGLDAARRSEQVGERDFDFNRDLASANLAGSRAGIYAGLGQAEGGFATSQYAQRANERDAGNAYGFNQFNAQHGLLNTMGGLEAQRYQQDLSGRNEQRVERDWQNTMSQQGMNNEMQRRLMEEQLYGNQFDRQLRGASTYGQMGYGNNPSGTYLDASNQYAQSGAQGSADFARQLEQQSYLDYIRRQGGIVN